MSATRVAADERHVLIVDCAASVREVRRVGEEHRPPESGSTIRDFWMDEEGVSEFPEMPLDILLEKTAGQEIESSQKIGLLAKAARNAQTLKPPRKNGRFVCIENVL